jgi:hypothetical protein
MHEFRSQLDGQIARLAHSGVDASSDAVSAFEHQHWNS